MKPCATGTQNFRIIRIALVLLLGLVASGLISCVPPGHMVSITEFNYSDASMPNGQTRPVQAGQILQAPSGLYQPYWLEFRLQAHQLPTRAWFFVKKTTFAWELWLDTIQIGASGSVVPPIYISYLNASTAEIPPDLIRNNDTLNFRIHILPDSYPAPIPTLTITDDATGRLYERMIIPLNREAYRSVAMICLVLSAYFLIYYQTRKKDLSGLFAGLFNVLAMIYIYGLSQSWEGQNLPMARTFAFFKAAIIPAFLFLGFYIQTFHHQVTRRQLFSGLAIALVLAAVTTIVPYSVESALQVFGITIIPAFFWMVWQFLQIIPNLKKIPGTLIMLLGGTASIFCALYDLAYMYAGSTPVVWLQGVGLFILQITIFMTLAARSAKNQGNLESYADNIAEQVRIKTGELEKLNQELRSASLAKTAFLAHMSHEIRTPLNSIMGFAQLLQDNEKDSTRQRQIHMILQESKILLDLINEVLDVSRIEGGKLRLEEQPFCPREVFAYSMESMSSLAKKRAIKLDFEIIGSIPDHVTGDSLRLQQILHNVLGNAIKFTLDGSVTLTVNGQADKHLAILDICVKDTGIGIPADKLDRIFQSFEQVDTSITRRFGGSGLGLTIVRELVRLMGGTISLESQQGHGTKVYIHLPFKPAAEKSAPRATDFSAPSMTRSSSRVAAGTFKPDTLLLAVEDYEPNVQLLRMFLEPMGARIAACPSGMEALVWLESNTPDLIFMDLHLPDMDGYETTRQIRSRFERVREVPVVALTADAWSDVQGRCLDAGMQDVLTKPLYLDQLVRTLKQYMGSMFELNQASTAPQQAPDPAQGSNFIRFAPVDHADDRINPGIHIPVLAEHFGVEEDDVVSLVDGFFSAGDALMADLAKARKNADLDLIHQKSHALKGGALNIQAHALADAALLVEKAAKNRTLDNLDTLLDQLNESWRSFRDGWKKR